MQRRPSMDPRRCGARETRESIPCANRPWLPDPRARCAAANGDWGCSDRRRRRIQLWPGQGSLPCAGQAGDRVRLRVALVNVEQKSGGVLLKTSNTLEIEGSDKPALIAESLALITPRKSV